MPVGHTIVIAQTKIEQLYNGLLFPKSQNEVKIFNRVFFSNV
jgi:hypothetical protein